MAEQAKATEKVTQKVKTYRARRRIKLEPKVWREPGELVPEAHLWFRVDSWAHTGWLEEIEADADELNKAISKHLHGEDAKRVLAMTGLDGSPVTIAGRGPEPGYLPARKQPYPKGGHPRVEAKTDVEAERDQRSIYDKAKKQSGHTSAHKSAHKPAHKPEPAANPKDAVKDVPIQRAAEQAAQAERDSHAPAKKAPAKRASTTHSPARHAPAKKAPAKPTSKR